MRKNVINKIRLIDKEPIWFYQVRPKIIKFYFFLKDVGILDFKNATFTCDSRYSIIIFKLYTKNYNFRYYINKDGVAEYTLRHENGIYSVNNINIENEQPISDWVINLIKQELGQSGGIGIRVKPKP